MASKPIHIDNLDVKVTESAAETPTGLLKSSFPSVETPGMRLKRMIV